MLVGGTYEISSVLVHSMIVLFKRRQPKIPLILRSNTIKGLEQMMLKGNPEIAVTSSQAHSADLASELCIPLRLAAFAATGVLRQRSLTLLDLETLPLIIHDNRDARGPIETLLLNIRKQGYRPNVVMRCESPKAVKAAVMRKLGIGILYQGVISEELCEGQKFFSRLYRPRAVAHWSRASTQKSPFLFAAATRKKRLFAGNVCNTGSAPHLSREFC